MKTKVVMYSIILLMFLNCFTIISSAKGNDDYEKLIYSVADCVNAGDVDAYIELFSNEIRLEMKTFIANCGKESFFEEEKREIKKIEISKNSIPEKEKLKFDEIVIFNVTERVTYKDKQIRETYKLTSGEVVNEYVLVKEDGKWYIYRISALGNSGSRATLSQPIETFIYFTKSTNINFYGSGTSGIYWDNYLRDVLPNEWTISYYGSYPHYGYASALASKMYAWYYTENPKWNFAPYYACMKDNSSDQNYLLNSYWNLAQNYRTMQDNVMSFISNKAIVRSGALSIFEVHYHATSGGYHSGTMSASGCLSKAQAGELYTSIIHYYYDNTSYTGTSNTAVVVNY